MQFYHILYPSSPESERNTFTSLESLHLKSRHSDQGLNGLRVWGSQSVTFRFVRCVKVAFGMWTFCKSTSSRIIGHKINWNGVKLWLLILQAFSESERRSLCFCAAFLLVPLLFFGRNQHLGLGIDWIDSVSVSKSCDFSLLETPFQTSRWTQVFILWDFARTDSRDFLRVPVPSLAQLVWKWFWRGRKCGILGDWPQHGQRHNSSLVSL